MKKISIISASIALGSVLSIPANALEDNTIYGGVNGGYQFTLLNDESLSKSALRTLTGEHSSYSSNASGGYARIHAGFNYINDLGFELGYSFFDSSKSTVRSSILSVPINAHATNKVSSVDLLGVYRYDVAEGLGVNLKAGIAYVMNKYEVKSALGGDQEVKLLSSNSKNVRPKVALGLDYEVYEDVIIGVSYDFIAGRGKPYSFDRESMELDLPKNSNYSPTIHAVSVGIMYTFQL